MTLDAHQHFWKFNAQRDTWITKKMSVIRKDFLPDQIKPLLDRHHIAGCISVQADQSEDEIAFLLSLAEQHRFIRGVVGWVDLRSENLADRLAHFSQFKKLKGFRHVVQGEPKGFLSDPAFIRGVKLLAQFGYTYDLLIYHHQLEEAVVFLEQVPEVRVVVDHIAKPSIATKAYAPWAAGMAAVAAFPNVSCKLSGMVTEAPWDNWKPGDFTPYLDRVFNVFGAQRLMYGSDWPVCLLAGSYKQQYDIVSAYIKELSVTEKLAILGENARRFYNI
ncbi:MAG TPA: amidohydrolase family protein [Ohtaekwangia sp.]|nr:amidohydrolase family protein [Ohtaekwangia sp.]